VQVRISKLKGLLLTRVAFETCSGLPGTVITCAEAAAVSRSSLTIVGPRKLGLFMNALVAYSDALLNELHLEVKVCEVNILVCEVLQNKRKKFLVSEVLLTCIARTFILKHRVPSAAH
jgi:hypothetical protein